MSRKAYKKVEVVGTSAESFSDATRSAISKASESLHHLDWFEVVDQRGLIEDGEVALFQVTVKIGFRLD